MCFSYLAMLFGSKSLKISPFIVACFCMHTISGDSAVVGHVTSVMVQL